MPRNQFTPFVGTSATLWKSSIVLVLEITGDLIGNWQLETAVEFKSYPCLDDLCDCGLVSQLSVPVFFYLKNEDPEISCLL